MAIVAAGIVHQDEVRERAKRLQELFANDPEVASITYRFSEDWSGDDSIFFQVALSRPAPPAEVISRLSGQIRDALLSVIRSEELGLHAYVNFRSRPEPEQAR